MSWFGSAKESYLGIDLGAENFKVVELSGIKGRPRLLTYGSAELLQDLTLEMLLNQPKKSSMIIKKLCAESKTQSRKIVAALPVSSIFSSIINLPRVTKKELAAPKSLAPLIHWEAKKLIPLPLEEMILDWQVLPVAPSQDANTPSAEAKKDEEKNGKIVRNVRVLLTAAAKETVKKYVDLFKLTGMQLLNLETDIFALSRSLVGNDRSTIMVVDLGGGSTNISIVDVGVPYMNKTISLGGKKLTEQVAKNLGVDWLSAEQFKKDLSKNSSKELPQFLKNAFADLVNEVTYSMNLFANSHPDRRIEKVILTGGSCVLPGLSEYLTEVLKIRTYLGDPWARVSYPEDLRPVLDEIGPRFSVAIGLAMRNIVSV